ncbi:MAG: hypothetical protein ACYTEK_28840 [Planctomycetota bacterium]|jgi:hypothetical protein
MRTSRWLIAATVIAAFVGADTVKAQDEVTVGATADFLSKYIWRGQNLVDEMTGSSSPGPASGTRR